VGSGSPRHRGVGEGHEGVVVTGPDDGLAARERDAFAENLAALRDEDPEPDPEPPPTTEEGDG
jgi:hypothetical protein